MNNELKENTELVDYQLRQVDFSSHPAHET
jgi:hypothetical protein